MTRKLSGGHGLCFGIGGHKYDQKALKIGARNRFEEAFWGPWALFWEPWGDFRALLTMVGPFLVSVARFFNPWLFFLWLEGSVWEPWALFLELLGCVFWMFPEIGEKNDIYEKGTNI